MTTDLVPLGYVWLHRTGRPRFRAPAGRKPPAGWYRLPIYAQVDTADETLMGAVKGHEHE